MNLSHFEAAILFALFSSVVLGVITKRTDAERLRYGVRCFAYFVADEARPRLIPVGTVRPAWFYFSACLDALQSPLHTVCESGRGGPSVPGSEMLGRRTLSV
jgi:hypothetical protein